MNSSLKGPEQSLIAELMSDLKDADKRGDGDSITKLVEQLDAVVNDTLVSLETGAKILNVPVDEFCKIAKASSFRIYNERGEKQSAINPESHFRFSELEEHSQQAA